MEVILELLAWVFGEAIFAGTGYALIYLITFGRVKPSQVSETTAIVVGIGVWVVVIGSGLVLIARRR